MVSIFSVDGLKNLVFGTFKLKHFFAVQQRKIV